MIPPSRRLNESNVSFEQGSTVPPQQPTYLVQKRSLLELFYVGIYTGTAFSVIFIISESIPVFVEEMSDEFSPSAIRGIAIAIWSVFALCFVIILSHIIPLKD